MRHPAITALASALMLMASACASIGRPEGGPRDETPPLFVRANPPASAVNVNPARLEVYFDENVKIEDPNSKVVVSPIQKTPPRISANGRRLTVNFQDTLLPDATYTIDFADAISDLNEGNVLDGFALDFSTGPTRDSLVIAGKVFQASNLEPAQGMLVGVHSNLSDTAISKVPFVRIAKTNQKGEFVMRNLAPGQYNIFAVEDVNRDYRWDRSENIAFLDTPISPRVENREVADTLRATNGSDSIVSRTGTFYFPNDLLLCWFNENYRAQYLRSYTRPDSTKITLEFGAPVDSMPSLTILNGPMAGRLLKDLAVTAHSSLRDTIDYWITAPELIAQDTILAQTRYRRTDSLDNVVWTTDTLRFTFRAPQAKEKKKKDSKKEQSDSVAETPVRILDLSVTSRSPQELNLPLALKVSEPLAAVDPAGIRLEIKEDTIWYPAMEAALTLDSIHRPLIYSIPQDWIPETTYRLTVDSAAVTGIYGAVNRPLSREFTTRSTDDYSTITFNIPQANDSTAITVELLNGQDKPVKTVTGSSPEITFTYVAPATYYARAIIDRNANGLFDGGNLAGGLQPEEVYYFPGKINVKKNWDIKQPWDLYELPVDAQKPAAITKNKPKLKAGEQQPAEEEEPDEDIDPFTGRPYGADAYGRGGADSRRSSGKPQNSVSGNSYQSIKTR